MIINGGARGGVSYWSNHLLSDAKNDRAEVMEISGLLATDLPTALREMQAIAAQSRSQGNFMYCANLNPRDYEHLTADQWREAVDTLEKDLGLDGHQRVVVEHEKDGRTHRHVVWNRVDVETLRVSDIGFNYYAHERTARDLEERLGLDRTPSRHGQQHEGGRPERAPELSEIRAAERSGIEPKEIKAELTELWRSTDSGKAFAAALAERGYVLAKGDRRDFCIVDEAGDAHSLARRLDGAKAQDVRERMADIDRASLPSVAEARAQQRGRPQEEREQTQGVPADRTAAPSASLGKTAGEIRLAYSLSHSGDAFVAALDERGMSLARVDAHEAQASARASAYAKELGRFAPRYQEGEYVAVNQFGNVYKLGRQATGRTPQEVQKFLSTVNASAVLNVADTRDALKEITQVRRHEQWQTDRPLTDMETKIQGLQREAVTAGAFAAALYREGITIARVDAQGIAGLAADQRWEFQNDRTMYAPTLREGELVAVNRAGGVHRLNPYKLDMDGIELALTGGNKTIPALGAARDTIADDRAAAKDARDKRNAEFWSDVVAKRDDKFQAGQLAWKNDLEERRLDKVQPVKTALRVADSATGATSRLADFVLGLFGGGSKPPASPAQRSQAEQIKEQRQALAALDRIRDSMARGKTLKAEDIRDLTPTHLANIRAKGDDYLRNLIDYMEYQRARARERDGRGRER